MALRGKNPELVVPSKPKFLISGKSGIGKTWFALDFPKPYLIDSEGGANREQYQKKLRERGGLYLGKEDGSQDFKVVIDEIKSLIQTKHDYKTLIIDSFTYLYMLEASKAEELVGSDFGRDKKEAQKPTRQLIRWLEKLDMTVIIVCHEKEKWARRGKEIYSEGTTFDGWDKMEYALDLWIEILSKGDDRGNVGKFRVKKSRIESLPGDQVFDLKYEKFSELYGKDIIEKESTPVVLASKEQVEMIKKLVEAVNIDQDTIDKWMKKADADSWEEMTAVQIAGCIGFVQKKLADITPPAEVNVNRETIVKDRDNGKVRK